MSTKIYNGFLFVPKDISTINRNIGDFRHKLDKYIAKEYKKLMANIASYFFDEVCCGMEKNEKNESPISHTMNYFYEQARQIKISPERNMFDYGCSATIHLHKKRFYGILYVGDNRISRMFFAQKWIREYGYWDNTDPLEGINYGQWQQRGKDWDDMLKDFNSVPSMNGLVAELTREMYHYIPMQADKIMPFVPSYEKRVDRIAFNSLFEDFCKMKKNNEIVQEFFSFEKWIKEGNPGFEKLVQIKEELGKKVKKEITKEMLIGK